MFQPKQTIQGNVTIRHDESDSILVTRSESREGFQLVFDDEAKTARVYSQIITKANGFEYAKAIFDSADYKAADARRDAENRRRAGIED